MAALADGMGGRERRIHRPWPCGGSIMKPPHISLSRSALFLLFVLFFVFFLFRLLSFCRLFFFPNLAVVDLLSLPRNFSSSIFLSFLESRFAFGLNVGVFLLFFFVFQFSTNPLSKDGPNVQIWQHHVFPHFATNLLHHVVSLFHWINRHWNHEINSPSTMMASSVW